MSIHALEFHHLAVVSNRIIAPEKVILRVRVRKRVFTHGARLRIVVRRVDVQVEQILGRVFAHAQVAHRSRGAAARRSHRALDVRETRGGFIVHLGVVVLVRARIVRLVLARVGFFFIRAAKSLLQLLLLGQLLLHRVRRLVPLHHPGVIVRVEPVVSISLTLEPELQLRLHVLIRRDVLLRFLRVHLARSLQTILLRVRHRAAILACPFAKLGRSMRRHPSLVPITALRLLFRRL